MRLESRLRYMRIVSLYLSIYLGCASDVLSAIILFLTICFSEIEPSRGGDHSLAATRHHDDDGTTTRPSMCLRCLEPLSKSDAGYLPITTHQRRIRLLCAGRVVLAEEFGVWRVEMEAPIRWCSQLVANQSGFATSSWRRRDVANGGLHHVIEQVPSSRRFTAWKRRAASRRLIEADHHLVWFHPDPFVTSHWQHRSECCFCSVAV